MSAEAARLAEAVLAGDRRAIARAITLVEAEGPSGASIIEHVFPRSGGAYLIGVTGAPGVGKSTLVDRTVATLRGRQRTVAVLAVDPTSPFSGGALLGDRVRMQTHAGDPGVFVRSMATRGQLGGLARATSDAAIVLDAAGFEVILIETVGVGQAEIEVSRAADMTIVVTMPGTGDGVQALKAGVMEIADLFVVNKADHEGADRAAADIEAMLALNVYGPDDWRPPVLRTQATEARGVADLVQMVERFRARGGEGAEHRRRARAGARVRRLLSDRLVAYAEHQALEPGTIDRLVDEVAHARVDPYSVADQLLRLTLAHDRPSETAAVTSAGHLSEARERTGAPMKATLDHIGIAVRDLEPAVAFYRDALGLEIAGSEEVPSEHVRAQFIPVGDAALELLEATSDRSAIARAIARRGPGLHHITLRVDDLSAALARLKARGIKLVDEQPRPGAGGSLAAFIHPSAAHGVLVELVEKPAASPHETGDGRLQTGGA